MSVSCVTRQAFQTSRIPTNDVVSSTRLVTVGGGVQTSHVTFSTISCFTSTSSSSTKTGCQTSVGTSTITTTGTATVTQDFIPVIKFGYTTLINTLYETICTTIQTPVAVPSTTSPIFSATTTVTSHLTITSLPSTQPTASISQSTVGPSDNPGLISSLAVQDQPSASSSPNDGVSTAPLVGGVVGGVGGALLLGLLLYLLLFRKSTKSSPQGPLSHGGQPQADPRHYEYTPVQSDQGDQFGRMLDQGSFPVSQLSRPQSAYATAFDPFADQQNYYQASAVQGSQALGTTGYVGVGTFGGGTFAATHFRQGSTGTSESPVVGPSASPSSFGSVSSTAPIVRQQPAYGSTAPSTQPGQYRGIAEPIDSRL